MLANVVGHFKTITKHKILVFKLCCKAGEPWRGFMHDWSKYSPTEFWEGVKYYTGTCSPIIMCKKDKGYSKAWLHHKGRNKHHPEYWYDYWTADRKLQIPYKYAVEMICDNLAAGKVYKGKNWTNNTQLEYWNEIGSKKQPMNAKIISFVTIVLEQVSKQGIDKTISKKNLSQIYNKCVKEN